MSSGSGVVAGPEVDMEELDAASSGPLAVDLNLNLGPSFALELALGGQDFEESVPVSRPNWPRFEPGILAGGQEDEVPPMAEESLITLPLEQQGSASIHDDLNRFDAGNSNDTFGGGLGQSEREPHADVQRSLVGLLQAFRNVRHTRHPRRPRQVLFTPVQDLVQSQDSSEHGSTSETRPVGASDTAGSLLRSRTNRNEGTPNTALEIAPSSDQSGKAEAASVGANFECNVCLELATEPVVTCCGHLFCWPCLYKWLHLHSSQKECPICKGFISDDAITPIYGRGTGEDTEKKIGSTPPRPHAHRVNGKRRWLDRFIEERLERGSPSAVSTQVQVDSNEGETSNAAELVLNRLRVAQRLQREYIDERFRMRIHQQRLMGRRGGGAFRPPTTTTPGPVAQASPVSSTPSSDQHRNENVLTRIAINRLETADSLAAIGASMDGLREGLEHMQRTLEIVSTLPTQAANLSSNGGADAGSSGVARPLFNESRISPPEAESHSPRQLTDDDLQVETPELPQTLRQRAVNGGSASGSSDSEPGSLHARKRRRLN